MREILFKAKRKDKGEWVEGYYCKWKQIRRTICVAEEKIVDCIIVWMSDGSMLRHEVIPDTNCQYTGGRDKYHTKIWENDICKVNTQNIDEEDGYFVVQWDAETLRFVLTGNGLVFDFDNLRMEQVEVIGNVFDNPELLEV